MAAGGLKPPLQGLIVMTFNYYKCEQIFLRLCALILIVTAVAKVVTLGFLREPIHDAPDSLFGIQVKWLLATIAGVELLVAASIYFNNSTNLNLGLVAFLSSQFLSYRLFVGDPQYCQCLGSVFEKIPFVGGNEWLLSLAMTVFMLTGSLMLLFSRKTLLYGRLTQKENAQPAL